MKPEKNKKRERFDRNAEASSRGSYVHRAHIRMKLEKLNKLREFHNENEELILEISSKYPVPILVEFFGEYIKVGIKK